MNKRILIVEDEGLIVSTLEALLKSMDIDFISVKNGLKAYEEYKNNKFDLIITDIFMPEMDGFQLIEKIRKEDKKIPIIVVSGFIDNETIRKIKNLGANEYIEKPFSLQDVKKIIIDLVGE